MNYSCYLITLWFAMFSKEFYWPFHHTYLLPFLSYIISATAHIKPIEPVSSPLHMVIYLLFGGEWVAFVFVLTIFSLHAVKPNTCFITKSWCSKLCVCERSFIYCIVNSLDKAICRYF